MTEIIIRIEKNLNDIQASFSFGMYRSTDIQLSICNVWLYHNHMSVAECRLLQVRFISTNVSELINLVRSVLVCMIPVPCVNVNSLGCNHVYIHTEYTQWGKCKWKPNRFYTILIKCMHVLYLVFSSLLQYAGVHNYGACWQI